MERHSAASLGGITATRYVTECLTLDPPRNTRNGLPVSKPYVYRGLGYDQYPLPKKKRKAKSE